jgi:hypothetical protein
MIAMRMHSYRGLFVLVGGFAALGTTACGGGGSPRADACAASLLPGDLVITEIFANPAGTDEGKEWIEVYNAPLDLAGLVLQSAKDDGSSAKEHVFGELVIEPGDWVVLGGVIEDARPDYVDYGYGNDIGDLRNTAGTLAIGCGETSIDTVLYQEVTEATSRGLDGSRVPDATVNDDILLWCDAQTVYSDELVGTPGAANDPCTPVGIPTTCLENGEERAIVPPSPGDLVISEFHANPQIVEDDVGEWFEIYSATRVDLNGVTFGENDEDREVEGTIGAMECLTIEAGGYFVVARLNDPGSNGGIPVVDATFDYDLNNSTSSLFIDYGDEELDSVAWTSSTAGAASALDPDFLSVAGNDNPDAFCEAVTPYGDGDLGTPGAANDVQCDIAPPLGQCHDGTGYVDVISPALGDVIITEFHANPASVDDTDGEWFELRAAAAFHLNGLELGRYNDGVPEVESVVEANDCILVGVGDHVVIARETDTSVNGGLEPVATTFDFSLGNSDGNMFVGLGGEILDEITWATSESGATTALDPSITDPAGNDDPANWCISTTPYGDGDLGSPAEENLACGTVTPGTCNDGGNERPTVAPALGDLVITELMPDPDAVADASGEWFEVLVNADVDLNGLELGREVGNADVTLDPGGDCIAVTAGSRIVFARDAMAATNGGLDPVVATFDFGLTNSAGSLFVGYGGEALDVITWSGSDAGAASSLDPDAENPTDNDDQGNFCPATTPYGAGDFGTPGAIGASCGGGNMDGMCNDGGTPRAIVSPSGEDLVITEVMANPAAVDDAEGEWFEVAVGADVDLNGLQLYTVEDAVPSLEATLGGNDCIEVTAGSRIIFVRNATMAENGGLPDGGFVFAFGLVNSNRGIAIGVADVVLDTVTWTSTPTGASRSLDEGFVTTAGNDDPLNWCAATTSYGLGDEGTPAATNDSCG